LNKEQAKQSLVLTKRPNQYTEESADNQNRIFLPDETSFKTVDEKLYKLIGEEHNQKIRVQNIFDAPMKGILLPWNPQLEDLLQEDYPGSRILNPLESIAFDFGMVMEDHQSSKGVILDLQPDNKTMINIKGTTIVLSNSLDKRYGSLNKPIFDRQRQFTLQKCQEIKLTMSTAHHPKTNATTKQTHHKTWKLFPTLEFLLNKKITPERQEFFKIDKVLGPMTNRLKFLETQEDESAFSDNGNMLQRYKICHQIDVSDHLSPQHVFPKDQIHPHSQNLLDFC
jgi:hypothetical protein